MAILTKKQIIEILEKLDDGEGLEIRKYDGKFQIEKKLGFLPETKYPINNFRSTSLVSAINDGGGFKHFGDFGKNKSEKNKELSSDVVIGIFQFLAEINDKIPFEFINSVEGKFKTKEIDGYKGFYNKDNKLRFVIFNEKTFYNKD